MSKITSYQNNRPIYDKQAALDYLEVIKNFLLEYLEKANANAFVVGISGGIDSALVYAIAKNIRPSQTFGIVMPVGKMLQEDLGHIAKLEETFDDKFEVVDLSETFNSIYNAVNVSNPLAIANIKPRLRMTTLYAKAQDKNALVLGTDNLDETYIGYFTKYGDGGVDLLPISRLTKGEVRFLASLLNVPNEIINKAPSAGLWENQTDESELGFSYQQLDFYLDNLDNKELISKVLSKDTVDKIQHKHAISQHKRDAIYKPSEIK
ncbi:NAD(+) synthase [Mycoplasmopsis verecunda]|uniref:NH(3)-dependent NAD(+) synthetase n=1 Tax=Mycoplasmopsis verecunda TaxID=171291 RepID=A0A1T4LBK0_9BACT|nr:NAD(+) synthase [Mycoplasmopsis verecunda]WPB54806.1 NAD(+) synthase [Mycoplasmopsis verecunda]SJZ52036.1 NAD+ synthase [Mycoplasmopsis verecunda]